MESLLNRLLRYFQISENEYQKLLAPVSEENFASGHSFKDIDKCVEIVKEAIKENKKIYQVKVFSPFPGAWMADIFDNLANHDPRFWYIFIN